MIAVYARVSTDRQAKRNGTEAQEEALRARLARDGFAESAEWFVEEGGKSGRKLQGRAQMQRLQDAIREGRIDRVYSFSFSRLFRSVRDASDYISLTIDKGVTTICVSDGFTIDPASTFSKAMAQMAAVFAELAADCIRDAATAGIRNAINSGRKWGGARVGLGRSGGPRHSDAKQRAIAAEEGSAYALAKRYGVNRQTIKRYRQRWLQAGQALGASVPQSAEAPPAPARRLAEEG